MPSAASLDAGRYYAHPRNLFWDIVGEWFGVARDAPYRERRRALTDHRIALWDVLHDCRREGSLDSAIRQPRANDFAAFYADHPHIVAVFFNGGTADKLYRKHVAITAIERRPLQLTGLPSTSPANAGIPLVRKRARWGAVLSAIG